MQTWPEERRKHVVYLTRYSEYHCRNRECVAVRDRRTGSWQRWHRALRTRLVGSTDGAGDSVFTTARVGYRLFFAGEQSVLTSRLERAVRPKKNATESYSSRLVSGVIGN